MKVGAAVFRGTLLMQITDHDGKPSRSPVIINDKEACFTRNRFKLACAENHILASSPQSMSAMACVFHIETLISGTAMWKLHRIERRESDGHH